MQWDLLNLLKVALFIYLQPVVAGSISVLLGRDEITVRLLVSSALDYVWTFIINNRN